MTTAELKERYEKAMEALKREQKTREEIFNRCPALSLTKNKTNFRACKYLVTKEKEVSDWYLREMEKFIF